MGGREGRKGRAEASSQSPELWQWEKTVTLSSQKPPPKTEEGFLSLGPLGLQKARQGYFLRRKKRCFERVNKKKKRGERGGWGDSWLFLWGSRMGNALEGATAQHDNKTKQQQNTNSVPLFPHCDFHNKHNPQNATGSQWGIHREHFMAYIKLDCVLMFLSGQSRTEQTAGVNVGRLRKNFDLQDQKIKIRLFSRWGFPPVETFWTTTKFRV